MSEPNELLPGSQPQPHKLESDIPSEGEPGAAGVEADAPVIFAQLESEVHCTAISPDGRRVIAGLSDGTLHLFDVVLDRGIVRAEKCSITEADEAEETANRLEIDVQNGIRRLKAASKVRMAEAKLQTGFRAYQAVDANAALLKAKANGKLAKHLLNQRQSWAELGYGVERTIAQTDSQVSTTRYKYLGA